MISAVQKKSNDIDSIEQDISSFLNNSNNSATNNILEELEDDNKNQTINKFFDKEMAAMICRDIENKIYDNDYNKCFLNYCAKNGLSKDSIFSSAQIQEFHAELIDMLNKKYGQSDLPYKLIDFVDGSFTHLGTGDSYVYDNNGCQAGIYEVNGEYVVVCRGTEFKNAAKEFYKDFIERDVLQVGYDKIPTDYYVTKELLEYAIKLADNNISKIHIVGHSLGGAIAQLLGALDEFRLIDVTTFNAVGVAHLLDNDELASKLQNNAKQAPNITNYATANDWVSLIFDIIGGDVNIVEPANRDVSKEYLSRLLSEGVIDVEEAVYLSIITEEQYAENGHAIENFISSGNFQAFVPAKKEFLPKTISFIVEHLLGNDKFSFFVAKIVKSLTKNIDSSFTIRLMKIFGTDMSDLVQPQSYIQNTRQKLYGSITMENTPDEFDYLGRFFIDADFKFVAKLIDKDKNINFYLVCRLGFNPTEKNRGYKTKLKTAA